MEFSSSNSESSIQALVTVINQDIVSKLSLDNKNDHIYSLISPSAYDTAWLAMIPHPNRLNSPMFKCCLEWVLNNQNQVGFWGDTNGDDVPTTDTLPATLACMVALKRWKVGHENIRKGLEFIQANTEPLLEVYYHHLPRWFAFVFPAMVELAEETGLELLIPDELKMVISDVFSKRQQILETEELVHKYHYPPFLSYLETLPSSYDIQHKDIIPHLSKDGSLFQSPAATARAFLLTGDHKCMDYLQSLIQRCPNGVPPMYPIDEELIKLCMVNQIERLGLAEHFQNEIEDILVQVYRGYKIQESGPPEYDFVPLKIYKDSLAFRLLRMRGYKVTPWNFCWFMHHDDILVHIEQNAHCFASVMYNVYRAADVMFAGEFDLQEATSFSRKILEKALMPRNGDDNVVMSPNFRRLLEHELAIPWIARLNHLDHRMWIEENKGIPVGIGKFPFFRLPCLHDEKLMQLAVNNYEFRQSIYRNDLKELERWSKEWGLADMGFGREKTTYCYFAIAASTSLPHDSVVRMIVAKSAIIITVADDFFDMEGSLVDCKVLTEAIEKWDGKGLSHHGMTIFKALDNLVSDIATKYRHQHGTDITKNLQNIWHETFASWLTETTWGITGYVPTINEYLKTGMTSIAAHAIVLPASCFLNPSLPSEKLKASQYETITKLLMAIARLLNDTQSYEKEEKEGKMNLVSLLVKGNPHVKIEDSVTGIKEILLDGLRKELVEHVFTDNLGDMPKNCKHLHLSCLKVFQMFFNSSNLFDSKTELLQDIKKAIYIPPTTMKPIKPLAFLHSKPGKDGSTIAALCDQTIKNHASRRFVGRWFPTTTMALKCNVCFI